MEIIATAIKGLHEIRLEVIGDARGRFKRHFCEKAFAEAGLETRFVQMNHAVTLGRGTIRGMHYQRPPAEEVKLVSCTYGRVFDVAVDLRPESATYRSWAALELDESVAYYIPKGCAHGFQALTDEAHLVYLHSAVLHARGRGRHAPRRPRRRHLMAAAAGQSFRPGPRLPAPRPRSRK